jgi:hypothetical protein
MAILWNIQFLLPAQTIGAELENWNGMGWHGFMTTPRTPKPTWKHFTKAGLMDVSVWKSYM